MLLAKDTRHSSTQAEASLGLRIALCVHSVLGKCLRALCETVLIAVHVIEATPLSSVPLTLPPLISMAEAHGCEHQRGERDGRLTIEGKLPLGYQISMIGLLQVSSLAARHLLERAILHCALGSVRF